MWRILRPDSSRVWKDPETLKRLSRYRGIIDGKFWAKYILANDIGCNIGLESPLEELWTVHSKLNTEFAEYVKKVDSGDDRYSRDSQLSSLLDLKNELAQRILQDCHFCERRCGVNRLQDEKGWCKLDDSSRLSSAFLHTGEEAPLVPSGTIFFSSCCLACVFCQNADISTQPDSGQKINVRELAAVAEELRKDGAININYVGGDPVPNTHTIIGSLRYQTSNVTQLWNSSMYCSEETMNLLMGLMDVYLPDFKYGNNECGERLSGVKSYFDIISRNHLMAYESGEVIVRHLVLPNHIDCCTIPILEWIAKNIPNCMVNIMAQYRPEHRVVGEPNQFKEITTRVSGAEMQQAFDKAEELGICWRPVS